MKRVTSWPQAVLGLAFSWGALIGWSATFASLALAPVAALCRRPSAGRSATTRSTPCRTRATTPSSASARPRACSAATQGSASALFYAAAAALALAAILIVGGGPIALIGWLAYAAHLAWQASKVEGADAATALPSSAPTATRAAACSPGSRCRGGWGSRGLLSAPPEVAGTRRGSSLAFAASLLPKQRQERARRRPGRRNGRNANRRQGRKRTG